MIEMHVRKKHEVDITDVQVLLLKAIEQQWNAAVNARVYESGASVFDD